MTIRTDVVVIGAGYYGVYAITHLADKYPDMKFILVEKESEICTRASSTNQGQFHRGYMYSAKPKLALECSIYAQKFESEFPTAINRNVKSFYGIHKESIVSSGEFETVCSDANLPLKAIKSGLFGRDITNEYEVYEGTIDTNEMKKVLTKRIFKGNIEVYKNTEIQQINKIDDLIQLTSSTGLIIEAKIVINACFASINTLHRNSGIATVPTRNDVFLHFMLDLSEKYAQTAATVIVGNYCSLMPSSYRASHLLAVGGVRSIANSIDIAPEEVTSYKLAEQLYNSCIDQCVELMPFLKKAKLCGYTVGTRTEYRDSSTNKSLSEVKVLENYDNLNNYTVLLGGKISCLSECIEPLQRVVEASRVDDHNTVSLITT